MRYIAWIAGIWFFAFGFWPGVPWHLDHGAMSVEAILDWMFHWFGLAIMVTLTWDAFRRTARKLREEADRKRE